MGLAWVAAALQMQAASEGAKRARGRRWGGTIPVVGSPGAHLLCSGLVGSREREKSGRAVRYR